MSGKSLGVLLNLTILQKQIKDIRIRTDQTKPANALSKTPSFNQPPRSKRYIDSQSKVLTSSYTNEASQSSGTQKSYLRLKSIGPSSYDNQITKRPIQKQQSLKKPVPYGVSVINNFNIKILEEGGREAKSPPVPLSKGISVPNEVNTITVERS